MPPRWPTSAIASVQLDAAALAELMHALGEITELIGRAGSYAGLRFSIDTHDPPAVR